MSISKSINLAYVKHNGQFRKYSGIPYIFHCYDVLSLYKRFYPYDEDGLSVCALHDTLEDTDVTEQEIIDASNENVLYIVKELTNPSKGSKLSRKERKQMDRDHLQNVSYCAKLIKLCDRICNLQDVYNDAKTNDDAKQFSKIYVKESRLLLGCLNGIHPELEYMFQVACSNIEFRLLEEVMNLGIGFRL